MFDITPLELEDGRLIAYAAPAHVRCVLCMHAWVWMLVGVYVWLALASTIYLSRSKR